MTSPTWAWVIALIEYLEYHDFRKYHYPSIRWRIIGIPHLPFCPVSPRPVGKHTLRILSGRWIVLPLDSGYGGGGGSGGGGGEVCVDSALAVGGDQPAPHVTVSILEDSLNNWYEFDRAHWWPRCYRDRGVVREAFYRAGLHPPSTRHARPVSDPLTTLSLS